MHVHKKNKDQVKAFVRKYSEMPKINILPTNLSLVDSDIPSSDISSNEAPEASPKPGPSGFNSQKKRQIKSSPLRYRSSSG